MPSVKQIKDIQANIVRLRNAFNSAVTGAHALGVYTELTIYQPENIATIQTSIMIDPDALSADADVVVFEAPAKYISRLRDRETHSVVYVVNSFMDAQSNDVKYNVVTAQGNLTLTADQMSAYYVEVD